MNKQELKNFLNDNQQFWPMDFTFRKLLTMSQEELIRVKNIVIKERDSYNSLNNYTKIEPPIYKVASHFLNEYELRQLMADVKQGRFEGGYTIEDCKGNFAVLLNNGTISGELYLFN